jgi:hypothetical protein
MRKWTVIGLFHPDEGLMVAAVLEGAEHPIAETEETSGGMERYVVVVEAEDAPGAELIADIESVS